MRGVGNVDHVARGELRGEVLQHVFPAARIARCARQVIADLAHILDDALEPVVAQCDRMDGSGPVAIEEPLVLFGSIPGRSQAASVG